MANLTFLDLLFAEALASGLAREARRAERPPPENFFLLPRDPDAWNKIQVASKKENMVVCIEFTDNSNDNCKRVQGIFLDLAREFEGIPFVRAVIGLGNTYNVMRAELGGVQFTPTILMVFYGDDGISRAKFEGMAEIMDGMTTGKVKGVIKELIQRRVKLKTAERLAETLASQVQSHLSDKERRIRQEYESKLERQMSEKEEEFRKKEEERKRMEEEEEQEKDRKLRLENEKLRQERPKHLEELLKMNLDSTSIKSIKIIMEKMHVSHRGCLNRADLKERLMENVPELRIRQPRTRTRNSSASDDSFDAVDPLGAVSIDNMEALQKELDQTKAKLDRAEAALRDKENIISTLKKEKENIRLRNRSNSGTSVVSTDDSAKVKNLETQLLETRMLYTTNLQDYEILNVIHDGENDKDCDSVVLRAKCVKQDMPNRDRAYAMKILTNYLISTTQTQAREKYQNEYDVLCQLPPHKNIIHMWAFFYDRPGPRELKYIKQLGSVARGMALFILMDEHPQNMAEHVQTLVDNKGPYSSKVVSWFKDLVGGLVFLEKHGVVHRDLKMSNLLCSADGSVIISDFGKAIKLDGFKVQYIGGYDIGGNRAHLAPELLNCRPGPRNQLDYSKQPVWAAGVLAYELAGHQIPFASGTIDQRGYGVDQLPALKSTYCSNPRFGQSLPPEFTKLVRRMLEPEPTDRPSLQQCLDEINNM